MVHRLVLFLVLRRASSLSLGTSRQPSRLSSRAPFLCFSSSSRVCSTMFPVRRSAVIVLEKGLPKRFGIRALSQGHNTSSQRDTKQSPTPKVVVFGGNGFVGQNVCQAALRMGADVVSVNRSGAPAGKNSGWKSKVRWVQADIFKPEDYAAELSNASGAISCVGAFGSNEQMEKICGDATVEATEAAEKAGVERFVFISAAGAQHEHPLLRGYWKGKQKAEKAILERFPEGGLILRAPGIYGDRVVGSVTVPLGLVMRPVEMVLGLAPFAALRGVSPLEPVLTPPVAVENVSSVAAAGALGVAPATGVVLVDDINRIAKEL